MMKEKITRRSFLKLSGISLAAVAVLTGCGPAARYVTRKPYYSMPEFSKLGQSTYYATTCRECPAGCGLILRTMEGRAIKAEGNPNHPVSQGKICQRGLTSVQGLYNPDRVTGPVKRNKRGEDSTTSIEWDEAISAVTQGLQAGSQTAFLLGLAPDHLFDLTSELARVISASEPVRYGATGFIEGRSTLLAAAQVMSGRASLPVFDIANSDLIFSFGADFLGSWMSPVSYGKAYGAFRRTSETKKRGYLVCFEPRMGVTSGSADEWIPVAPGSEGLVAKTIANLVAEIRGESSGADLDAAASASGVSVEQMQHLAELFARAQAPLAIPGGSALNHANGLETAQAVLSLNLNRIGQPGGMSFTADTSSEPYNRTRSSSFSQLQELVRRMESGQVQTLFIHGVNPVFDLPASLGFEKALQNVNQVISFTSFPDETALVSDYVLPDHTALESFGYQSNLPGTSQKIISAMQPVVSPLYNTRATADVLLAAAAQGGYALDYTDEVAFIQSRVALLLNQDGSVSDETTERLWASFLQYGGWWKEAEPLTGLPGVVSEKSNQAPALGTPDEHTYHLLIYATHFGDGSGANRPWLQETPDPMTTVMWNSWVEINPKTAEELGIHHDDLIKIKSPVGEIEATAYLYPAIRPDTIAIPFGQGHSALGRYAEGRGVNPMQLVEVKTNASGDLALNDTLVTIEVTGRKRPLARLESIKGVYGKH